MDLFSTFFGGKPVPPQVDKFTGVFQKSPLTMDNPPPHHRYRPSSRPLSPGLSASALACHQRPLACRRCRAGSRPLTVSVRPRLPSSSPPPPPTAADAPGRSSPSHRRASFRCFVCILISRNEERGGREESSPSRGREFWHQRVKRDQSDPHVAELSTQRKKQNMLEKYVEHISKKNKLRIGSNIFRNLFVHLQLTQMIARQYKRYIRQFRQKKEKKGVRCKHRPQANGYRSTFFSTFFYRQFLSLLPKR
jgi:hypothetical protein